MGIEMSGFDELQDELDRLARDVEEFEGTQEVPFDELFPPAFMRQYTDAENIDSFIDQSQWDVESQEDFKAIPENEFDQYVAEQTLFGSWEAMMNKGAEQYVVGQLDW